MTTFGRVRITLVWSMLDACCGRGNWTADEKKHYYCVRYGRHTFPVLPKGEHGRGNRAEIQLGVIKRMARLFEILDCAQRELEQLR
jgi:hypothetical protein